VVEAFSIGLPAEPPNLPEMVSPPVLVLLAISKAVKLQQQREYIKIDNIFAQ
jgi:hypothetical protein